MAFSHVLCLLQHGVLCVCVQGNLSKLSMRTGWVFIVCARDTVMMELSPQQARAQFLPMGWVLVMLSGPPQTGKLFLRQHGASKGTHDIGPTCLPWALPVVAENYPHCGQTCASPEKTSLPMTSVTVLFIPINCLPPRMPGGIDITSFMLSNGKPG